jgi:hypothetical protein
MLAVDGSAVELKSEGVADAVFLQLVTQVVLDTIKSLNSETGPGFLSVEDDNGFIQVASSGSEFLVEWSEFYGTYTKLYVAGFNGPEDFADTEFLGFNGVIPIMSNERLTLADADFLCSEFVNERRRPDNYCWRELCVDTAAHE